MIAVSTRLPTEHGGNESAVTITAQQGALVVTVEEGDDGGCTLHVRRAGRPVYKLACEPQRPTSP